MIGRPGQTAVDLSQALGIIDGIYAAVRQPNLWCGVIEQIADAIGGESIAIFAGFPDASTPEIFALANTRPDAWAAYAAYYAAINPLMAAGEAHLAPGDTWLSDRMVVDAALEKTEFYQDFFRAHDMYYSAGLRIALGPFQDARLSCQRPHAPGPFDHETDAILQILQPHLERALLLHHEMASMRSAAEGLEAALDRHEHAVIGIGQDGAVKICNRGAQAVLRAGGGLGIIGGRLKCLLPHENSLLEKLLLDVLSLRSAGGNMKVHLENGKVVQINLSAFRSELAGRGTALAALVFLVDPAHAPRRRENTMRALYGLTPTEARIADLLLAGLNTEEIGERLRITIGTTRFYVKSILSKTGQRRQSDLLRLMLMLPGDAVAGMKKTD